jgi:DNA-binding beta-propeller fold protein YncE
MRFSRTLATFAFGAACATLASAQDGNLAEPSIDTAPIDISARQSPWGRWDISINHKDRVYTAGDPSGSVTVTDPFDGRFLGTIPLTERRAATGAARGRSGPAPAFGFSPNGRTLAVVSTRSDSVDFVETDSNRVVHTAKVEGSPVGATYSPNGKEVWIPVQGGDYVSVHDAKTFAETARLKTPGAPGMTVFSNNGRYAYVCSASGLPTVVFDVSDRKIVASLSLGVPSCRSIAASPDGKQVWLTSMEAGKAVAFAAKPPFQLLRTLEVGPGTRSVNFVSNDDGQFAYVSAESLNAVTVYDTRTFGKIATIPVGGSPSAVRPSGDGSRVYVGLGAGKAIAVIDAARMKLVDTVSVGQAVEAVAYVPYAVRSGRGEANLQTQNRAWTRVVETDGPTVAR